MPRILRQMGAIALLSVALGSVPATGQQSAYQAAKLLPADAEVSKGFGQTVAVSGDTVVIGARSVTFPDQTAAYVFTRSKKGDWAEQQLIPDDAPVRFGHSVAISGDTALIGAADGPGLPVDSGAVYVFVRGEDGIWTQHQKLIPHDGAVGKAFGFSVAVDGDTAMIGASLDSANSYRAGSVYVFNRFNELWFWDQKLFALGGATSDGFGGAIALSGDTAVISATGQDSNGLQSGAAYVFARPNGFWAHQQMLLASDGAAFDGFGVSVAVSGDTIMVGTRSDDDFGQSTGSAYVFVRTNFFWTQHQKLLIENGGAGDHLGASIALSGDTAVIGAYGRDHSRIRSGAAYVFTESDGSWVQWQELLSADGEQHDQFGTSVSMSGDTVVVGTPRDQDNGFFAGSVYVFEFLVRSPGEFIELPH